MIVAGEPSGDAHAAALVNAIKNLAGDNDVEFFGSTGPLLRDAGVEPVVRSDDLAIMGLLEVGRALPRFWQALNLLKQAAASRRPDAVILVDWPEFNLRLARALHRIGIRVIYYISPQLWAWRPYRVRSIARDVDLLLSILPFEKQWYEERGVAHVEYVGHPLAGQVKPQFDRDEFSARMGLAPKRPIVSLLPGSRHKEVQRILPPLLDAAGIIFEQRPEIQFVVVAAPSRSEGELKEIIRGWRGQSRSEVTLLITRDTREALAASNAAAVASGTATLEAALLGTPMVIVYKESAVNWNTLGRLISVDHYGLVNLVAGQRVVTELMQDDLNGEKVARELLSLLNEKQNREMRTRLNEVARQLGEGGASERAAEFVIGSLRN